MTMISKTSIAFRPTLIGIDTNEDEVEVNVKRYDTCCYDQV
jgi:hypothetical protein